uniref:Serine/threonine-protein phosphatase n=1 Tax=Setaria italica TaxID=4555 RepID=K3YHZ5_SETIT
MEFEPLAPDFLLESLHPHHARLSVTPPWSRGQRRHATRDLFFPLRRSLSLPCQLHLHALETRSDQSLTETKNEITEHPPPNAPTLAHAMSQPGAAAATDPSPSPASPPVVEWPEGGALTRDWVAGLAATLDWCSRHLPADRLPTVLPPALVQRLVLAAAAILHREPNLVRVDPRPGQAVVVVGDVHGQLHDVIFLLRDAGFPSEERIFVFNGDYVDRGAWGLETLLLLLAWKVLLPNCVFLLRGNHESKYCTSVYGFEREVMAKYKDQGPQVYRKFLRCFEDLPLATIIAGCVYTAHGGIFRGTVVLPSKRLKKGKKGRKNKADFTVDPTSMRLGSLDELLKARRTVLDPPWEGQNLIPGDVLWSDPSLEMGLSPNKERGIGLLWGPDITQQFLRTNNLKVT